MKRSETLFSKNLRLQAGLSLIVVLVVFSSFGPLLTDEALDQKLDRRLETPSLEVPFGTDPLGRNILARLASGGVNSLVLSTLCVAVSLGIGLFLGLAAGWLSSSVVDKSLLRLVDIAMAFPGLLLALLVAGPLGGGPGVVAVALILTGWTDYFRLARSLTLKVKTASYVEAGRLSGLSGGFLLRRYILPKVMPHLTVLASLGMGRTILYISSLGFLGIGLAPPKPEWGAMIAESLPYMRQAPHTIIAPAAAIFIAILGFYMTGQGLARQAMREGAS
jgi:ABC-type dipeptide/oligopeptide/nickel transport system permease subunit